jgi:PleD family two-component response regulator
VADRVTFQRAPVVLLASAHEWSFRAIETVLAPSGYVVARAHTGEAALKRAHETPPDVIIIDADLAQPDGLSVCHTLRNSRTITRSTPILLVTPGPTPRQQRIQAMRAGATECLSLPLDAEEFALRLTALVAAKRDADQARDEGLVDNSTGLYNARGLARRALELGAHAYRRGAALACVVFSLDVDPGTPAVIERIAKVFSATQRASDAAARLGPTQLAVLAPDTDGAGAVRLAERLALAVEQASEAHQPRNGQVRLRAGYDAVPNFRKASLDPAGLLERATSALDASRAHPAGSWIRSFQPPGATFSS